MTHSTERERDILVERGGCADEPTTLEELSQKYGISRERVRQIEVRAFEKLQRAIKSAALERELVTRLTQAMELEGPRGARHRRSRNIGRAIAAALAAGGAAIAINARASRSEADAAAAAIMRPGRRGAASSPATSPTKRDVARIVAATVARFGGLDILVNNAAVRHEAAIDELDFARWREAIAVMLDGPFLCVKACLPASAREPGGTIVNMGGMTAQQRRRDAART